MADAAGSGSRGAVLLAALAALAAGAGAGWVAGRRSAVVPPPAPPVYVNPLADAKRGEFLAMKRSDGTRQMYRVVEEQPDTVLLDLETAPAVGAPDHRQARVGRTFLGVFAFIEGDVDALAAEANLRDFRLETMEPVDMAVPALGRTLHCWRIAGQHRVLGPMTFWVSDELPVHGLVRVETARLKTDVTSFDWGR